MSLLNLNLSHKSFELIQFVEKLPLTIDCMTCYDNIFILGTNGGRMLVYEVKINQTPPRKLETSFEKSINATKKPIQQLDAVKAFGILIALFDSQIHIFDLDKFQLQYSIAKTKNCSLFTSSISNDQKLLRLCVVCKRKLQFFYTVTNKSNNNFMELISDLELSDTPRTIEFTKDNLIVFALKKDYYYYEIPTTSASINNQKLLEPRFSSGNRIEPLCQKLFNDFIVLGIDENKTIVYDTKGKPYLEYPIIWSNSPSLVCSIGYFMIGMFQSTNTVEIVTIQPTSNNVQLLEFSTSSNASSSTTSSIMGTLGSSLTSTSEFLINKTIGPGLTSTSNSVDRLKILKSNGNSICYIANSSNVWCLTPIKINEQLEEIIRLKNFDLGLHLISSQLFFNKNSDGAFAKSWQSLTASPSNSSMSSNQNNEKSILLKPFFSIKPMLNEVDEVLHRRIKNLNALDLFSKKRYSKSFQLFQEMNTDPSHLIAFLPGLLPDVYRQRLNLDEFFPILDAKEQEDAIACLIDYLQFKRNEFLKDNKTLKEDPTFILTPLIEGRTVFKNRLQILQIIDTTLLKCYLKSKENLVPFFLRRDPNFLHLGESERLLNQHNKTNELIILYEKKEEHEKALSLLMNESSKAGFKNLVEYLKKLGNKNIQLILKYAKNVIESDSHWGIKIFTSSDAFKIDEILISKIKEKEIHLKSKQTLYDTNQPNNKNNQFQQNKKTIVYSENSVNQLNMIKKELDFEEEDDGTLKSLDRELICRFLQENIESKELSNNLIRIYLQYCVFIWNDINPNLNNLLIDIYKLFIEKSSLTVVTKMQVINSPTTYKKMLNYFLSETNNYEHSYALSRLDLDNYAEERAIVLGKMGKHHEALTIYVNILSDTEKAEAYCEKIYSESSIPDSKQVFYQLLKIYLNSEYEEIRIGASIRLLNAHSNEIGTSKTLELLPAELMKCKNLSQFFENMLNRLVRNKHDTKIKNRLMIALELQVHETKIMCQGKRFTVTDEQICKECNKRMGKSAMVRYPNGILIHYGCLKSSEATYSKN